MYTYSAVVYSPYRIGYAEENDNKGWYVGKSTSPSVYVVPPNTTSVMLHLFSLSCIFSKGMLIFSIIFYVGSLVGIILLYVFFTEVSGHSGYNQIIVLTCCTSCWSSLPAAR